jgi:hypothetical protein
MCDEIKQFEASCDAPPYSVARAYEARGLRAALDVRWCRLSHLLTGEQRRQGNVGVRVWQWLRGRKGRKPRTCTCGQPLPDLKRYGFTLRSKKVGDYLLGQCCRCGTVFWDETLPVPAWLEEGVVELTDYGES